MSEEKTKTEQLEELREKKLEERAKARDAQYEKDLEARIRLEDEHGPLAAVKVVPFKVGYPTHAYVKTPSSAQYKRYKDLVQRAADDKTKKGGPAKKSDAIDQLARDAWVYPESEEERARMHEALPGILTPIFVAAVNLAEGRNEDEGNG